MINLCKCGCGRSCKKTFIHGHNNRNPNYRFGQCNICSSQCDKRNRTCSKKCKNLLMSFIKTKVNHFCFKCCICSKEIKKKRRKTCSRFCFSELSRQNSLENWKSGISKINTGYIGIKGHRYKNLYLRSSWELEFAKYMDSIDVEYEYEKHRINLVDQVYIPDFYLPKFDMFIEIKGWLKPKDEEKLKKTKILLPKMNLLVINRPPPYNWVF